MKNFDDENINADDDYLDDYSPSRSDKISDAKDIYDDINNKSEKVKEINQKMRSNKGISNTGTEAAKKTGEEATKKAGEEAAKKVAEEAVKEGGKLAAQEAGAGTTAAAAPEIGIAALIIIAIVIILFVISIIIAACQIYLASEQTYDNLFDIISYRESISSMPIIKMPGNGLAFMDNWFGNWLDSSTR